MVICKGGVTHLLGIRNLPEVVNPNKNVLCMDQTHLCFCYKVPLQTSWQLKKILLFQDEEK